MTGITSLRQIFHSNSFPKTLFPEVSSIRKRNYMINPRTSTFPLVYYQKIVHQHHIRTPYSTIGSVYEKRLEQNLLRKPSSAGDCDRTYMGQKNLRINERVLVERDITATSQTRRAANSQSKPRVA